MTDPLALVLAGASEPPLDPSGDEARRQLRRELAHPEYYDANLLERILDWLDRLISDGLDAASASSTLTVAVAIAVALLLIAVLLLVLSRALRVARSDAEPSAALSGVTLSADQLRVRAEAALAAGDPAAAVVDAFRATALRQIESGRIEDIPQATAHELARALAAVFAEHATAIRTAADLFDAVLYGDRPATAERARELLALDEALTVRVGQR